MTAPTFAIPDPIPFDQLLSLKGRCAIVTGGTRGIGEAVVLRLAQAGASVVVTARGQEGLTRIEAKVTAVGGQAAGIQADAAQMDDTQRRHRVRGRTVRKRRHPCQ
jgi:NAD(P)-dependent dehydrogenase (short-subunit alcohol dehydrogenase family)